MDEFLNGWINFFHSGVPKKKKKPLTRRGIEKGVTLWPLCVYLDCLTFLFYFNILYTILNHGVK